MSSASAVSFTEEKAQGPNPAHGIFSFSFEAA